MTKRITYIILRPPLICAYYLTEAEKWGKEVVIVRKQDDLPLNVSVDDFEKYVNLLSFVKDALDENMESNTISMLGFEEKIKWDERRRSTA